MDLTFTPSIPRIPPRDSRLLNPYTAVHGLTGMQQAIFWSGWFTQFGQTTHALTTAITLTLLFRPVGAILFGLLSDRFGRKWPLVGVLLIIAAIQVATGFVDDFSSFLASHRFSAMGGVWGLASAASMESIHANGISRSVLWPNARYFTSSCIGIQRRYFSQGVIVSRDLEKARNIGSIFVELIKPSIFWVGAGMSTAAAFTRALLPETAVFSRSQKVHGPVAHDAGLSVAAETRIFFKSFRTMLRLHWKLWIYGIVLLSALNFINKLAHGSQDLYTTFMQTSKGFSADLATKANIIGETGAVCGAALGGWISQSLGRRMTLLLAVVWILPDAWGQLSAGAFFFQLGVNIAWGSVAVYLNELAPGQFRGLYPGTVYQLGNAASAAAAQIEATAGLSIRKIVGGVDQPDYASIISSPGKVQAIMAASSCALLLVAVVFGPERHSVDLEAEHTAIEDEAIKVKFQSKDANDVCGGEKDSREKVTIESVT
ncbi:MFS general substrate transporter [Mycena floridula]|nr:MFS general substrate transporter [Mycena floridula]